MSIFPEGAIYFDLGNVLLTFSNEKACAQLAAVAGVAQAEVESLLLGSHEKSSFLYRYERGEVTDEAFYLAFCRAVGSNPDYREFELDQILHDPRTGRSSGLRRL